MKPNLLFAFTLMWSILVCPCGRACDGDLVKPEKVAPVVVPDILVVNDEKWKADRDVVRAVLESSARPLAKYFASDLKPILVYPSGGPMVLYNRGPKGEYVVLLNTGSRLWAQHAFQFAHELCHIFSKYDRDPHGNDWFEESLCELASLYTLREMGQTWKTDPPFSNWTSYAKHLTQYADDRMEKYQLNEKSLADWYKENADELHGSSTKREMNNVVATALLSKFESTPEHWSSVAYLNVAKPTKEQTFKQYLLDWQSNCPEKHQEFVAEIALEFGFELSPESSKEKDKN